MFRSRSRRSRVLAATVAASLILAACGSDDDGDDAEEPDGTESTADEPAADEPADDEPADDEPADDEPADDEPADDEPAGDATAAGLTPIPDGVDLDASVSMSFSVAPNELDPDLSRNAGDNTYMYLMFDRLTEIDNDLNVIPMLATDWEYSDDGTTFTMQLRDDVTFHDGTPFDAAAVVANLQRSKSETSAPAASLAGVESVEAIGDYEVQFNLPDAKPTNLPVLLAGNAGAMISPAYIEAWTEESNPVDGQAGSGPYAPVDWRIGESVSYERADGFWDPGRQLLAELSVAFVQPEARINGVRTGEFDLGQSAASDAAQAIEIGESGAYSYTPYVINTVYGALFNPGLEGDLANPLVRQAIMHAMDRDAINEGLFDGTCEPRFQPFPEGNKNYFPSIEERYPHDPDLARELIAESGIENPSFDILVSPGSYEPFAQVMQAQLDDVGITMNIIPSETSAVPVEFITGNAAAVYLVVLGQGDVASVYSGWYAGAFGNLLNPEVPEAAEIRAAADAIDASMSEEEQLAAWESVFTDIQELAVFAPGCAAAQVWMYNPDLIGVDTMPYIWAGSVVPYTLGVVAD